MSILGHAIVGLATGVAASAFVGPALALDEITFGTNWVAEPEHGGYYQAVVDGTYEKYGLKVTIVPKAQGRIADRIDELRRELNNPAVLQVTATPYSLYLQPDEYEASPGANFTFEPKRPAFTTLVPIHSAYVGGDHYFGEHDETEAEFYLWHAPPHQRSEASEAAPPTQSASMAAPEVGDPRARLALIHPTLK